MVHTPAVQETPARLHLHSAQPAYFCYFRIAASPVQTVSLPGHVEGGDGCQLPLSTDRESGCGSHAEHGSWC